MNVGGQAIDFMVDTGVEHSMVTQPVGSLSQRQATIVGPQVVGHTVPSCILNDAI